MRRNVRLYVPEDGLAYRSCGRFARSKSHPSVTHTIDNAACDYYEVPSGCVYESEFLELFGS